MIAREPQPLHRKLYTVIRKRACGLALVVWLSPLLTMAAWRPLVDFNDDFDLKSVRCSDAKVVLTNAAHDISTGHDQSWPGATLPAVGGHWDLSAYAAVWLQVKNTGTNVVTVHCRVDNPGADGTKHCVTESLELKPGQTNTLKVRLPHEADSQLGGQLFGMRGYPVAAGGSGALEASNITQLVIFVNRPAEDHSFEVADIRAGGEHTPPTAWVTDAQPYFPFIDTFGQYKHKDWPGKVHSLAELQQRRTAEALELDTNSGPSGWDKYGGLAKGPQLYTGS